VQLLQRLINNATALEAPIILAEDPHGGIVPTEEFVKELRLSFQPLG
jgi:hypothetical protein